MSRYTNHSNKERKQVCDVIQSHHVTQLTQVDVESACRTPEGGNGDNDHSHVVTAAAKATVDDLNAHDGAPVDQHSDIADVSELEPCDAPDPLLEDSLHGGTLQSCDMTAVAEADVVDLAPKDAIPVDLHTNNVDACRLKPCHAAGPVLKDGIHGDILQSCDMTVAVGADVDVLWPKDATVATSLDLHTNNADACRLEPCHVTEPLLEDSIHRGTVQSFDVTAVAEADVDDLSPKDAIPVDLHTDTCSL